MAFLRQTDPAEYDRIVRKRHDSVAVSASVLKLLAPAMVGKAGDELLWCRGDGQPLRPPTTTHWFGAADKRCQAMPAAH